MSIARLVVAGTLLGALVVAPGAARADTICTFGGPAPGFRVARLDLAQDAEVLVLRIMGQRTSRVVNDGDGWHLAQGIMVLNADTLEIEAYQLRHHGNTPTRVVVEDEGNTIARASVVAPEGPFLHDARRDRAGLPRGSYYVVAFGTGTGSNGSAPQWWQASVDIDGIHACSQAAGGETFDIDQTEMSGGSQVSVPGAGIGRAISARYATTRPIVVGMVDSAVQGPHGEVHTCLTMSDPARTRCIGREIVPFAGRAGAIDVSTDYDGVFPIVALTGAAFEIPV